VAAVQALVESSTGGAEGADPTALDLPGPSRRIRIEPIEVPEPTPATDSPERTPEAPSQEPPEAPEPDPVRDPRPEPEPVEEPDPDHEPVEDPERPDREPVRT
jgi:hypothetical protein